MGKIKLTMPGSSFVPFGSAQFCQLVSRWELRGKLPRGRASESFDLVGVYMQVEIDIFRIMTIHYVAFSLTNKKWRGIPIGILLSCRCEFPLAKWEGNLPLVACWKITSQIQTWLSQGKHCGWHITTSPSRCVIEIEEVEYKGYEGNQIIKSEL